LYRTATSVISFSMCDTDPHTEGAEITCKAATSGRGLPGPITSLILLTLLTTVGCSNKGLLEAQSLYRTGQLRAASSIIRSYAAEPKSRTNHINSLIAQLELGSMERATGDIQASRQAFERAHIQAIYYDNLADVSLSGEALAAVTNLNRLPYRGTAYDRIMINVYSAANEMILGNLTRARVLLRRAYQRQQEAVDRYAKQIAQAEKNLQSQDSQTSNYNLAATRQHPGLNESIDRNYSHLAKYNAYADYVNPFAEFLQGIFHLYANADASDINWSQTALRRAAAMSPGNTYLISDMELANAVAAGRPLEPMTYVIFETGTAPYRDEIRIDLPLVLVTREIDYVGASFPRLVMNHQYLSNLAVEVNGQWHRTQLVADMDQIVAQEFQNELPTIITKTIIASATKAAIAHAIRRATRDDDKRHGDDWVNILARVAVAAYQVSMNEADLRTWASLPKQFQYARFPTPTSMTLQVSAVGKSPQTVQLQNAKANVIWVKSISPHMPLQIWQFTLQ